MMCSAAYDWAPGRAWAICPNKPDGSRKLRLLAAAYPAESAGRRLCNLSQPGCSGGDAHQLFEEHLLARHAKRLRVPLNGQHERLLHILDRLDCPVRCPRTRTQAGAHAGHRLVVEGVDAESGRAQRRRQPAAGKDRDGMRWNSTVHGLTVLDRRPDDIREVLVKCSAAGDIER